MVLITIILIVVVTLLHFAFKTPIGFLLLGPFLIHRGIMGVKNKQTSYKNYIYDGHHAVCLGLTELVLGICMCAGALKSIIV